MSSLKDRNRRHDVFYRKAKEQQYVARSVFKLQEIDEKHKLLKPGARVLDLGCRPGSWLQYAAGRIGLPTRGALVGIDRTALDITIPGARVLAADIYDTPTAELLGDLAAFDVVLSDMAPDTMGVRMVDQARSAALVERAFEIALEVTAAGGGFVAKIFAGPDVEAIVKRAKEAYRQVHHVRPKGTRTESTELFIVALGRKPKA